MLDEDAIDSALYGHITISRYGDRNGTETHYGRDRAGILTPKKHGIIRNTRLSAVLYCKWEIKNGRNVFNLKVFHNPWARSQLPQGIFKKLPQFVEMKRYDEHIELGWNKDINTRVLFT